MFSEKLRWVNLFDCSSKTPLTAGNSLIIRTISNQDFKNINQIKVLIYISKKLTNEEFLIRLNNTRNDIIPLEKYITYLTPIKVKCLKCENIFKISPQHLLSIKDLTNCPKCSKKNKLEKATFSRETIKERVLKEGNGQYEVINWLNYRTMRDKVLFKCNKCGLEFEMIMNNFLNKKQRCPNEKLERLSKSLTLDENHYIENYFKSQKDFNEYKIIGKINGSNNKVRIQHLNCGFIYEVTPTHFKSGKRCPNCSNLLNSKGVKEIKNYFNNKNIEYIKEFSFDNLISPYSNKKLRYDFFVPSKNILIEFDGEFHFSKQNLVSDEDFNKRIQLDKLKDNYALENNYQLIRINYKEINKISEILDLYF